MDFWLPERVAGQGEGHGRGSPRARRAAVDDRLHAVPPEDRQPDGRDEHRRAARAARAAAPPREVDRSRTTVALAASMRPRRDGHAGGPQV
jgi:hypothetical protein